MKDWHVNGCLNRQRANGQTNKQTRRVKARDWLKIGAAIQVQSLLLRSREIIESSARERERQRLQQQQQGAALFFLAIF